MAAIAHVFTITRVAELLGEDEDWLWEISIEMMPEDGVIAVHGIGEDYTTAFTDDGIENLRELVQIYKNAEGCKRRCKSGPVERRQLCCCVAE